MRYESSLLVIKEATRVILVMFAVKWWSPIRSVRFQCIITSIITTRIGRYEFLTNLNHSYNKICDILGTQEIPRVFFIRREEKVRACDDAHCSIIRNFNIQLRDGNEDVA